MRSYQTIINRYGKTQSHESLICPRCGQDTLKTPLWMNDRSQYYQVHICDRCSAEEYLREMNRRPILPSQWAICRDYIREAS